MTHADSVTAQAWEDWLNGASTAPAKAQYWRNFSLKKRCQADTIVVQPGARLEITYTGPTSSCGNSEVMCRDTLGNWVRVSHWNWNVPGSAGYVNGQNVRRVDAGPGHSGVYVLHSLSDSFNVSVSQINPPLPALLEISPSNPQDYAGFGVGWQSGTSEEFGSHAGGVLVLGNADDIGFNLTDAPKYLGPGGIVNLVAFYDVLQDNYWWQDMQVYVQVLNGIAGTTMSVQCADCENSFVSTTLSGGNEEVIFPVGDAGGFGQHSFTLTSQLYAELDCWGFESANSTGIPPAVSDLTILRSGNDIRLFWSAVPVASNYLVQSSPGVNGPWTTLVTLGTPNYTILNQAIAPPTQVYYQVIAVGP
ncbi:MAG: hypothetical protein IPP40_18330 [bacterium]|nr:hypothetical protein [bacterium]